MSYSDRHYGLGDPDCPICHGMGYVRYKVPEDHAHFGRVFDCECRSTTTESEKQSRLRRLGGLDYLSEKIFESFNAEGVGLSLAHQDNLRRAYESALLYAQNPDGWLILKGSYGCGKTHLAAAIANVRIGYGERAVFVTVPDLLDYLRSAFQPGAAEDNYQSRFEEIRTAPLLILDDLGIESPTPWAVEKLYQILNHRYNARLPTVITTNNLIQDMEERLYSRLSDPDMCQVIAISVSDYRRGGATPIQGDLNGIGLYKFMTFNNFSTQRNVKKTEQENLQKALKLARQFTKEPEGWLVLMGEHGNGKTHLAAAIANATIAEGTMTLFVTVADLLDYLRSAFSPDNTISYTKSFKEAKNAPILVLDDLGLESATPWAKEKLHQILNHRYVAKMPTIITTTLKLESLEKSDPWLVARLRDKRLITMFSIIAPAYRGEKSANSR